MCFSSTDFPAPEGPSTTVVFPRSNESDTPSSTIKEPNRFDKRSSTTEANESRSPEDPAGSVTGRDAESDAETIGLVLPMPTPGERETILQGPKFAFERLWTASNTGGLSERLIVRHPGAVCILAILPPGTHANPADEPAAILIRNKRPAIGTTLWELPAGTIDPGEDPATTAARELEEETGYRAETITPLGRFYTTPGMTDELMRAYLATGLTHVGQRLEPDESIEVHPMRLSKAQALIDSGELMDAKSILTLMFAQRRGIPDAAPTTPER